MKAVKRRSDCPVSFALDIFGDKWTLLIVRDLLFKGKVHYREFLQSEESIATNILADRLQTLERAGIVTRTRDPRVKTKVIYSLKEKGLQLLPIMIEIILWSAAYDPNTAAPKDFVKRARKNRDGLIREIRNKLEKREDSGE